MPPRSLLLALFLPVFAAGCSTGRAFFQPRENVRAQSPSGFPAAVYPLEIDGKSAGEVKVWSEGASVVEIDDRDMNLLHVGFEIENRSGAPMALDADACRVIQVQARQPISVAELRPLEVDGKLQAPSGQITIVDLEFAIPGDNRPRHVSGFRLEWQLESKGGVFEESTPFIRWQPQRYYPGYTAVHVGFWGPYYYPWRVRHPWFGPGWWLHW